MKKYVLVLIALNALAFEAGATQSKNNSTERPFSPNKKNGEYSGTDISRYMGVFRNCAALSAIKYARTQGSVADVSDIVTSDCSDEFKFYKKVYFSYVMHGVPPSIKVEIRETAEDKMKEVAARERQHIMKLIADLRSGEINPYGPKEIPAGSLLQIEDLSQ